MTYSDRDLAIWTNRAAGLIGKRLRDARSHAEAGRMGIAQDRLRELGRGLELLLGDAREEFFRAASTARGLAFDETAGDVARVHPILGRTPADVPRRMEGPSRQMAGAAATADLEPAMRGAIFAGWESRERDALTALMASYLSDAQVAFTNVVALLGEVREETADGRQAEGQSEAADQGQPGQSAEAEAGGVRAGYAEEAPQQGEVIDDGTRARIGDLSGPAPRAPGP